MLFNYLKLSSFFSSVPSMLMLESTGAGWYNTYVFPSLKAFDPGLSSDLIYQKPTRWSNLILDQLALSHKEPPCE